MLNHLTSRDDWNEKSVGAKGFTLIELLVVIIILGILAAVAIFAVGSTSDSAKKNACRTEKATVQSAVEAYNAQALAYPANMAALTSDHVGAGAIVVNGENVDIKKQLNKTPIYVDINSDGTLKPLAGATIPTGCTIP